MKKLVYFLVASVFLGAHILAIDIGVAKLSIYRIILMVVIATLFFLFIQNHPLIETSFHFKDLQYRVIYLFWLSIALLSFVWAVDTTGWIKGIFFVGTGILSIFFISTFAVTEKDLKTLFFIVFIMIGMHQLIGIYEIATNHYIWASVSTNQFGPSWTSRLPYSTFTNVNDYSTVIFAGLPIASIIFVRAKTLWLKLISLSSIIATVLLVMHTGSRGNQLALVIFVFTIVGMKVLNRRMIKMIVYSLAGALLISLILFLLIPDIRFMVYNALQSFINKGGSNLYRINMILNGFLFLLKFLGLGVGAGNVEYWLSNSAVFEVDAPNIHNWFMDILTGYGVIVFIMYSIMYVYILRQLYVSHKYSKNLFVRQSSLFLFAYVISFVISSISSATNIIIEWQWVYWGVIIAYVQYTDKKESSTTVKQEFSRLDSGSIRNKVVSLF